MHAFYLREEEFSLEMCSFKEINNSNAGGDVSSGVNINCSDLRSGLGLMCLASSDNAFKQKWGENVFEEKYSKFGLNTIWGWDEK